MRMAPSKLILVNVSYLLVAVQARLWAGGLWQGLQGSLREAQSKNCNQKSSHGK